MVLGITNSSHLIFLNKALLLKPAAKFKITVLSENIIALGLSIAALLIFAFGGFGEIKFDLILMFILGTLARINVQILSRYFLVFSGVMKNLSIDLFGNTLWFIPAIITILSVEGLRLTDFISFQFIFGFLYLTWFYRKRLNRLRINHNPLREWAASLFTFSKIYFTTAPYSIASINFLVFEKIAVAYFFDSQKQLLATYILLSKMISLAMHMLPGLILSTTYADIGRKKAIEKRTRKFSLTVLVIIVTGVALLMLYYLLNHYLFILFPAQISVETHNIGYPTIIFLTFFQILNLCQINFEGAFNRKALYILIGGLYAIIGSAVLFTLFAAKTLTVYSLISATLLGPAVIVGFISVLTSIGPQSKKEIGVRKCREHL